MARGESSVVRKGRSWEWPRLPGLALAATYVAICLAPLALGAFVAVAPASPWELAAAALGMAAVTAAALQFFVAGRFAATSGRLGIDSIMAFHKVAAWWILAALVLHPPLYVIPTLIDNPERGTERFLAYLTSPRFASGAIAWIAAVLLIPWAILRDRIPLSYEAWRAGHVLLALVFVGGAMNHAVAVGRFSADGAVYTFWVILALAVAAAMAVLYGWRWLQLHRRPWRLVSVKPLAERTWEMDIQPAPGTPPLDYRAGQFVWLTVGSRRFPLFDHPFSIADSPLRPGLSIIVKEVGDFTRTVGALPPGTAIGVDGPHGDFVLEERPGDAVLLVAGGAGIGPIMGLLRDLAVRRDPRPVRLAYAVGSPRMLACHDEIEAARDALNLEILLLSETPGDNWTGSVGILNRDRLEGLLRGLDRSRALALICGPGGMVTAVSDTLADLGLPTENIVYERFDYAAGTASRQDRRYMRQCAAVGAALAAGVILFALH